MKMISGSLITISLLIVLAGCTGRGTAKKESLASTDTITVPDTGFTGIKKYMSGRYLAKEVTFKNGVKQGLMKTYYVSGKVRQTFWLENGLRQDSSRWYFEEGQLFRTTPYKNDTVDGIQTQYYRTGKLKAKIGYKKGLRTTYFEEFTPEGKLIGGYPQLVIKTQDNYKSTGVYKVTLELSDKSTQVNFFRGDLSGEVFDTAHCVAIKTIKGVGTLDLKKTGSPKSQNVVVIAEILTNFGNNLLIFKKLDLPYNDLK
jgi:hypothetical protein